MTKEEIFKFWVESSDSDFNSMQNMYDSIGEFRNWLKKTLKV
jgi:hypothetical protein